MYIAKKLTTLTNAIKRMCSVVGGVISVSAALTAFAPGASASCAYSIESEWATGYVANIAIKNDTGAPING